MRQAIVVKLLLTVFLDEALYNGINGGKQNNDPKQDIPDLRLHVDKGRINNKDR